MTTIINDHNMIQQEFDSCILALQNTYAANQRTIDRLHKELHELRENYDKDSEIAALKAEIEELREDNHRGFTISLAEDKAIKSWIEKHETEDHGWRTFEERLAAQGCSGGRYSYHFLPTAIGTSGVIRCSCGAEFEFKELG